MAIQAKLYRSTFPDDLFLEIYTIYKEALDLKFKMWAINEHQTCEKLSHHKKIGLAVANNHT
eukprot:9911723-Ditylum_brightwellii.AAC.1